MKLKGSYQMAGGAAFCLHGPWGPPVEMPGTSPGLQLAASVLASLTPGELCNCLPLHLSFTLNLVFFIGTKYFVLDFLS